jgi:hypothetical protein
MYTNADRRYLNHRFDRIEAMLVQLGATIVTKENKQMASIQDVEAAVDELTVAVDAAVTAIGSATGITPAQLDPIVADIKAQTDKLTQALSAKVAEAHAAGM